MTVPPNPLSLASATRIDALCDQFEAAWRAGQQPRIEELLAGLPPADGSSAFAALLRVELELRQRAGEQPDEEQYAARFPAEAAAVSAIFAELARQPTTDTSVNQAQTRTLSIGQDQTASAPLDEPQPTEIGRFIVLSKLGEGAFGMVYRARDPQLDREVAIKIPRAGTLARPGDVERFLRESKVAATMHHPNICPVYEVGTANGRPFIVMALVPGKSLADHLQERSQPFPARQAALIVRKLAVALELAHQKGIIHRDLKPANVLIDDERKDVVVMDFGLARREDRDAAQLTHSGMLMGTPAYMSPEQARGDTAAIGPASDIYSLGVILYELLAGERPFTGSLAEVLGKILHVDPPPPSAVRKGVDPRLEAICMKAMARRPEDRYPSMRALADALSGWLKGVNVGDSLSESPPAEPKAEFAAKPIQPERASKPSPRPVGRRLWQVLTTAVLVAGLIASATVFFLQTPHGTVRVEINDPAIKVVIDKESKLTFTGVNKSPEIELRPGRHGLTITRGDFTFDTTKFELKQRGKTTLKIEFLAGNIQVTQDGKLLGSKPLAARAAAEQRDWPKDAPPPAIAPFDAALAKKHQQAWAAHLDIPVEKEVKLPGGEVLSMVLIPPGEVSMGSSTAEQARFLEVVAAFPDTGSISRIRSEGPQHRVRITRPFYLGQYEVTQAQWQSVMGANPSAFQDHPNHPVETVSWNDIQPFLAKVNEGAAAEEMSALPTEAQWEYACRAGTATPWHSGDDDADLREWAWFYDAAHHGGPTYPVGQLRPNAFGLYDLHGNVWEWCADWYAADFYANSPTDNPQGPSVGTGRVLRGGSWYDRQWHCRSAYRIGHEPASSNRRYGFRLTQAIPDVQRPPPAIDNAALLFDGIDDYVEVPNWKYAGDHPLTVEAWVTPEKLPKGVEIISTSEQSGFNLAIWKDDRWAFSVVAGSPATWATAPFKPEHANRRLHVAGVYDRQQVRLYLEGVEMQRVSAPDAYKPSSKPLILGGNPNQDKIVFHYAGQIDEVRLSRVARYAGNFQPRERLEADADTLALYHFDEGQGDVLNDTSGNNHHGKIVGATWVRSDGQPVGRAASGSEPPDQDSMTADRAAAEWVFGMNGKVRIVSNGVTMRQLRSVAELPDKPFQLTGFYIEYPIVPFDSAGIARLNGLQSLETFGIEHDGLTDEAFCKLAGLPGVFDLNIHSTQVTDASLEHVATMPKVRRLNFGKTAATGKNLDKLQALDLELLIMHDAPLGDEALAHLPLFPNLFHLVLGNTRVTDPGLAPLGKLAKLQFLDLGGTGISGAGLAPLKDLPALQRLRLVDAAGVGDEAVPHLAELKALTYLELNGTKVSAEGLAKLKAALPNCEIVPS